MSSGDDLQLAGELSCENATVRCNLFVGCDLQVGGSIDVGGSLTVDTLNATTVNATTLNATNVNATTVTATTVNASAIVADTLQVGALLLREENTPAITTTPQNNFVVANIGTRSLLRFMCSGAPGNISMTGIVAPTPAFGGYSRFFIFYNRATSTKTLTLEHNNAGSAVTNRFFNRGAVAVVLQPGEAMAYYYDRGDSRWVQVP